jgi:hypothetical protein
MARLVVLLVLLAAAVCKAEPAYYAHPALVPGAALNEHTGTYEIKVNEDGSEVVWYIFQDKASQTSFFFVPNTDRSQWEDPRSE